MIRAPIFKANKYDPRDRNCEDWGLWLRMVRQTKFERICEPLYGYRQHPGQITSYRKMIGNCMNVNRSFARWMARPWYSRAQKRKMFGTMLYYWFAIPWGLATRIRVQTKH
jgi:hypothetical protein